MFKTNRAGCLLLLAILFVAVSGCKPKPLDTIPTVPASEETPGSPGDTAVETRPRVDVDENEFAPDEVPEVTHLSDRSISDWNDLQVLRTIYFAFNRSELTDEAQATLADNANWLNAHPDLNLVIEGHCDERGTIEYNLALGQRRGRAVRDYLVNLGIDRSRVRAVSFGEERPEDPAHNEAAWSRNRRASFLLER